MAVGDQGAASARGDVSLLAWSAVGIVIGFPLVFALPLTLPLTLALTWASRPHAGAAAWGAFAYVTLISQVVGFFAWYNGLAMGGIARVGQVQLLQAFFTIGFAALLFGEQVSALTWLFALGVVATIAFGRRFGVKR